MTKFRSIGLNLALVSAIGLGFGACGGGSGGSTPASSNILTGTFVDSPVYGLHYKTATQNGYTNEKGEFKYKTGEDIEFILGDLSLGKVQSGSLITPYELGDSSIANPSNKTTNIAMILQNFDANRSNNKVLDVSKLKDFNFSDFNISIIPTDMETKISNKLIAGDLDNFIDKSNKSIIQITTVKQNMKSFVETKMKENNDISKIIGKTYSIVNGSNLLGYENKGSIKFTKDHLVGNYGDDTLNAPYEKLSSGMIRATWDENDIEYINIKNISSDKLSLCFGDTENEAKDCTVEEYWVDPNMVNNFLANKKGKLQGTLVSDFSEIKNKLFYNAYHYASGTGYGNIVMKIENNESLLMSYDHNLSDSTEFDGDRTSLGNFTAKFENKKLTFSGTESNGDALEEYPVSVYKYPLSNIELSYEEIGENNIFTDDLSRDFIDRYPNETITFRKGNMYCMMLWDNCWLDKDAEFELIDNLTSLGQ